LRDADYFSRLVVLVAGSIGEEIILGETVGLKGSDRRKAYRCAGALAESSEAIELLIEAAQAEARHVLDRNKRALDNLVTTLCERRSMSGDEVVALIERLMI
jgi:ATP-dependent Zn protease